MKRILLLFSVLVSTMMVAQGHETFDNFEATGNSYQNGTFLGQDGSEWSYIQCRGDLELNGKALTLGRNRAEGQSLTTGVIQGGIGTLNFNYIQAFSTDVYLEVYINDSEEPIFVATSNDELDVIKNTGDIEVNVEGDFVLKFINQQGAGQVTIDDIIWTEYDVVGVEDNDFVGFSFYPNPVSSTLNLTANQEIVDVAAFNLLGQQVIAKNHFLNGKVDVSSLSAGAYIFKVTFENGNNKTFKVIKR